MGSYKISIFLLCFTTFIFIYTVHPVICDCNFASYDLTKLSSGAPWIAINKTNENVWVEYEINVCEPLQKTQGSECSNAAVCRTNHTSGSTPSGTVSIGDVKNNSTEYEVKVISQKEELWVTFEGGKCGENSTYKSIFYFKCGPSLGSPVFLDSYMCDTYFEWYTNVMCKDPPTLSQVKCYVYGKDHLKRNLSPLSLKDSYTLTTYDGRKDIVISVCKSLKDSENKYPKGTGAVETKTQTSLGIVEQALTMNEDQNVILKYIDHSAKNCTTTITFVCPERGGSKDPQILSSAECHYIIEWQTEYACPEERLTSNECKLFNEVHGIDADFTPLKKTNDHYNTTSANYNFIMNICGSLDSDTVCPTPVKGMAACQQNIQNVSKSHVIGKSGKMQQQLSYIDGIFSLRYLGGDPCNHNHKQRETIINFVCDWNVEAGSLNFEKENDCTYIFSIKTKYACQTPPNKCTLNHGTGDEERKYDLTSLSRQKIDTDNWNVLKPNPNENQNSFWLNVCGNVLQTGDAAQCPEDASVCKKDKNNTYKSLGKNGMLRFNNYTKELTITYNSGSVCSGTKRYTSILTLHCKLGDMDSGPRLQYSSSSQCIYGFDWYTAAACPLDSSYGSNCKVDVPKQGYHFDLNPLKRANNTDPYLVKDEKNKQNYYINVCAPVTKGHCPNNHVAGVCQEDANSHSVNAGAFTGDIIYESGFITLTYRNGDKYNTDPPIFRTTEIAFLCDPKKKEGYPEFSGESAHVYSFRWYTKYACPTVPVDCSVQNGKEEYDLSSLSGQNWIAVKQDESDPTKKYEYYISVCQPLSAGPNSPAVSCGYKTALCEMTYTSTQDIIEIPDLGHAVSSPKIVAPGHLLLTYNGGSFCKEGFNYSSEIHFYCKKGALNLQPEFLGKNNNCVYKFKWMTEKACSIKTVVAKDAMSCQIKDTNLGYTFNLQQLMKKEEPYYTVKTYDQATTFKINICGSISSCGNTKGEVSPTVCMNGTTIIGMKKEGKLQYSEEGRMLLTYYGIMVGDSKRYIVEIEFVCNKLIPMGTPRYTNTVGYKYQFEFQTAMACPPKPVNCLISDGHGHDYNLNPLARKDDNWIVQDTNDPNTKYYINVCVPVVRKPEVKLCNDLIIGGCQVTASKSYKMGYIQSKPVADNGIITLKYFNGDLCHKGKPTESNRSTVIFFSCSKTEQGPKFREETPECQYVFDWQTPSACPMIASTGAECSVVDPLYGVKFNLKPLYKVDSDYSVAVTTHSGDKYNFTMNVCHHINTNIAGECDKSKNVGSCQQKGTTVQYNAGVYNSHLTYENGVLKLEYKDGTSCHGGNFKRSTVISFTCDHSASGKKSVPNYIEENDNCTYFFEWPTHLACFNISKVPSCRLSDSEGNTYDLSSLRLTNSNYEVSRSESKERFYINICLAVVNKKGVTCPPESGACLDSGDGNLQSIGKVTGKVLLKESRGLVIKYTGGRECVNGQKATTKILLQCPEEQSGSVDTNPKYLNSENNCTYNFIWRTRAACPIKAVEGNNCKVKNPQTGKIFDLSVLSSKDHKGYTVTSSGHQYVFDICQAPKSSCEQGTGVCQIDKLNSSKTWNAGKFNSDIFFKNSIVYLNYTDGKKCHNDQFSRNTIISFVCSRNKGHGTPQFVTESDECTYYIDWPTDLVCEDRVRCSVTDTNHGNQVIDLSPLVKVDSYYTAVDPTSSDSSTSYYINVCESLSPIQGTLCPAGSAICMKPGAQNPKSLGYPAGPPVINSEGHIVLSYVNGSVCTDNKKINSKIVFACQRGSEMGAPELMPHDTDSCEYTFKWNTYAVCTTTKEKVSNCKYNDTRTGTIMDFSKLKKIPGQQSYRVESQKKNIKGTYYINICGEASDCDKGDAVCLKQTNGNSQSYGQLSSDIAFIPEGENVVKLHYTSENSCNSKTSSTFIRFICDSNLKDYGKPTLLTEEDECVSVFDWKTPLVCPPIIKECVVSNQGQQFDLRMLSRPNGSWITAKPNGDVYHINLCQSVHDLPRCPLNAAVCRVTNNFNDVQVLGKVDTQNLYFTDTNLVVKYTDGTTEACPNKKPANVEIHLKCGNTLGKPNLVQLHTDECMFEFDWITHMACKESRTPVTLEDTFMLTEPSTQRHISLKKIQGKSSFYDLDAYRISLLGTDCNKAGKDSVVCQLRPRAKSLGDRTNAKFYFEGSLLQAEYTTNTKCNTDTNKYVRTLIEFRCSQPSYHTMVGPYLEYTTPSCEYIIYWYTPEMCFKVKENSLETVAHKHVNTAAVVVAVLSCIVIVCVIAIVFHSPDRRKRCSSGIRRLFRRPTSERSFQYSRLSTQDNNRESSRGLLSNADTGYGTGEGGLPSFHDDSDDDILL